jgi:hypothetical protein
MRTGKDQLYASPWAPGEAWDAKPEIAGVPAQVDAYFVPVGLWVRAETPDAARMAALDILDGMENVDTGEAGHVRGGFLMEHAYRKA